MPWLELNQLPQYCLDERVKLFPKLQSSNVKIRILPYKGIIAITCMRCHPEVVDAKKGWRFFCANIAQHL